MPLYFAAFTLLIKLSTPLLLKPIRLIIAFDSGNLNIRGLSLPACGRGVTVPTSIKPKPIWLNASMHSAFLSKPAAKPTGFLNSRPKKLTGLFATDCDHAALKGVLAKRLKLLRANSCAHSASRVNIKRRAKS